MKMKKKNERTNEKKSERGVRRSWLDIGWTVTRGIRVSRTGLWSVGYCLEIGYRVRDLDPSTIPLFLSLIICTYIYIIHFLSFSPQYIYILTIFVSSSSRHYKK